MSEEVKVGKVDEKINYKEFSAPTIDIYDEKLNKKMAKLFIELGEKQDKGEIENA